MNMKRIACTLVAFAVFTAGAEAQELFLLNRTEATLYVLEDPGEHQAQMGSEATYRQVPIDGVLPFSPGVDATGFAFTRGSFTLPTFALSAGEISAKARPSDAGRAYVEITDDVLTTERVVSASELASVLSQPRVDDRYLDWVGRHAVVARGRGRAPIGVFADLGGGRERITLEDSLLWQRGGTDLQWLKSYPAARDYFVAGTVYTALARGTTLFLYLYDPNDPIPVATLELPLWRALNGSRESDFALMWLPGRPEPTVVGNLVANEFLFEAQIWRDALAAAVGEEASDLEVEIATASSAAGIWEEFVLARDDFALLFGE